MIKQTAATACQLRALDKYYTKASVVQTCLRAVAAKLHTFDLIVEPAAGGGAFADAICHDNKLALDISPGGFGVIAKTPVLCADWLAYPLPRQARRVAVIGNPPFGKNNKLSRAFLRRAFSFANVQMVAFVLPNVYNKHTQQRIVPKRWRISDIIPLGENPFTLGGKDFHLPCSFFVFEKGGAGRDLRFDPARHQESADFYWGTKTDFDLFVFGAAPRKITTQPSANNRGHYLKAKIAVAELARRIRAVNWRGNSSASGGVYWLTKSEFVSEYNNAHYGG